MVGPESSISRDDRTGKGSRSIIWRESLDPFPDPYTDSPVADILPLPGAYPPIREPGDRNPAGIKANRGQRGRGSKAIRGIDGGNNIRGRSKSSRTRTRLS